MDLEFQFPNCVFARFRGSTLRFPKSWLIPFGGTEESYPNHCFLFKMAGGNPSTSGFWHNPNNCTKSDLYGWSTVPLSNFFYHDISRWVWIILSQIVIINNSLEPAVQEFSCPRYPQNEWLFLWGASCDLYSIPWTHFNPLDENPG